MVAVEQEEEASVAPAQGDGSVAVEEFASAQIVVEIVGQIDTVDEALFEGVEESFEEIGGVDGFEDVVADVEVDELEEVLFVGVGGDHDDGDVAVDFADEAHHLHAARAGHFDIGEDQIGAGFVKAIEPFFAISRFDHFVEVVLQCAHQPSPDACFVLDAEDAEVFELFDLGVIHGRS